MALNTAYQLTDGGGKSGGKKSSKTPIAGATKVIAQNSNSAVKTAVNTLNKNNATFKAEQAKAAPVQTKTASATVNKSSSGSSGGSSGGTANVAAAVQGYTPSQWVEPTWTEPTWTEPTWTEPTYQQSQLVTDAYAKLQALQTPTYSNPYESTMNQLYEQILNRKPFSYNVNADRLYQQYKEQYIQGGQNAMKDTMAQAAALTGGYGSSYAQTAGQQQYQSYLNELNNMVPTLANQAYSRYQDEGNVMRDNYGMVEGRYADAYSKYRDSMSDYLTERDYLTDRYDRERDLDWEKFLTNRNYARSNYESDRNYSRSNYESDRNYARSKFESDRDLKRKQYEYEEDMAYNKWKLLMGL